MTKSWHLLCLVLLMAFFAPPGEAGSPKEDEIARAVAEDFLRAVWKRDVDAALKLTDVPYCIGGKEILKKRDELKEEITDLCEQNPQEVRKVQPKTHVRKVGTLAQFAEEKKFRDVEEIFGRRNSLSLVLNKNDRVVFVELEPEKGDKSKRGRFLFVGVRLQNGKGLVVGVGSR